MALYGDMDISILDEKPANRVPIDTLLFDLERLDEIEGALARAIKNDDRVYWVCPLVEESEKLEISNATERFGQLKKRFGNLVEIVHGQMKPTEKEAAMAVSYTHLDVYKRQSLKSSLTKIILNDISYEWNLELVAKKMGIGVSNLRRKLADEGTGFQKILNEIRMLRALELIQTTNKSCLLYTSRCV